MRENYVVWNFDNDTEKIISMTEEQYKTILEFLGICESNGICDIGIEKAELYQGGAMIL